MRSRRPANVGGPKEGTREGPHARAKSPVSVKAAAVRMLARRDYSRTELAQRLLRRGGDPREVDAALDELERLGYLSDARFAHGIVAQRSGGFAKRAIAYELKGKGVSVPAAEDALAALAQRDELADATALWAQRFGAPPKDEREKARQFRFLLSRGYSASVALKVLRGARAEVDEDA